MSELFLAVLKMSITASYVILCVIIVRLLLKKAPKAISYALWAAAAFRLVIPFSFESIFSLLPRNADIAPIYDAILQHNPQIAAESAASLSADPPVIDPLPAPHAEVSTDPIWAYVETASYIWLFGIMTLLVYSLVSVLKLKKRLKGAQLVGENIFEAVNLETPFLFGIIKPKIYLPAGLDDAERSYILLHEQTHIRRKDHIIKAFAFLTLSVHWFNPLAWIAFRLMTADMELSCDEKVLKEMDGDIRKPYAATLLSLAAGRHILSGNPLAFGEGDVKQRIRNVLNYREPAFWLTLTAVIAAVAVGIGLLANPEGTNIIEVEEDPDAPVKYIQIEITQPGSRELTGRVITDKDGYKAGDTVSVVISESVTYDVESLVKGDWIDVSYRTVREKDPPEFVAVDISHMLGDYPSTFTLVENGNVTKSNTLRNGRVAAELPSLILSGSPEISFTINGVPDVPQYLIIDIGSFGDKIYYTFEKDGRCYVGRDNMYEISRETFDELMKYLYKNEIGVKTD